MIMEIPKRVEQHIINKSDSSYLIIKHLCIKSKNVYNLANYYIRQNFILKNKLEEGKIL